MHYTAASQTSHAVNVTSNVFTPDEITIEYVVSLEGLGSGVYFIEVRSLDNRL